MASGRSGQPGAHAVSAVRTEPDIAPGIVQVLHQPMAGKTVMGQAAKSRTARQRHVQVRRFSRHIKMTMHFVKINLNYDYFIKNDEK